MELLVASTNSHHISDRQIALKLNFEPLNNSGKVFFHTSYFKMENCQGF